ncbi:hypothetical protein E0485_21560 [Paenibacillus albiflavus]|uniref:Uncharacterized protein n=1 Tax=Paenibacillus albiflavus TaxID=2545760 RepID=A0A4R4E695_9BACL|nr:hypothetical protein [Paenibacillus albiflavus]TCZ73208.1 hypothetical protein E0485_21560 [Paenibacillus albiflavus]
MRKRKTSKQDKLLHAKKRFKAIRLHSAKQRSKKDQNINRGILVFNQERLHKNRREFEEGYQTGYKKGFDQGLIDGAKYLL